MSLKYSAGGCEENHEEFCLHCDEDSKEVLQNTSLGHNDCSAISADVEVAPPAPVSTEEAAPRCCRDPAQSYPHSTACTYCKASV